MRNKHSAFKLRGRHPSHCASMVIDGVNTKFLFFQLPLVNNDSGNAWCVKYIKIQGDRYMNQIKVKLRLNQTMKCSCQLSCCHLRSCLRFVLIADHLLKYDLCS